MLLLDAPSNSATCTADGMDAIKATRDLSGIPEYPDEDQEA